MRVLFLSLSLTLDRVSCSFHASNINDYIINDDDSTTRRGVLIPIIPGVVTLPGRLLWDMESCALRVDSRVPNDPGCQNGSFATLHDSDAVLYSTSLPEPSQ